jgi:tetratricopeptide (TPR) repeat protein
MPPGFANSGLKSIAACVAVASAVWLSYAGGKHGLASHYALSSNPENWERATRIEPDNPELWYRLGRFRHLDFDNTDIPAAITYYRRAVQLNPRSPYYKLDLADALEIEGDDSAADATYRAAQAAYPISPEVSWKYGNFLLRQNRMPEAFAEIRRAILNDPTLLSLAVSRVWHSDPDVHLLLDQVLPATPAAYEQALSFLTDAGESVAAVEAWNRLVRSERQPGMHWAVALTDLLVKEEKYGEAATVWRQATGFAPNSANGSLVYDGGFEKEISGGGFGWQQTRVEGADFDFDTDEKHSGERSARLTFDGTVNLQYENTFQYVLISPSTRYHFQGYLRTDQISTDSGVRFEILDPKDPRRLDLFTANTTGTNPWTLEQADFTTGADTHRVLVRVARRPSERLDNKIHGTMWIDDVAILPAGQSASQDAAETGTQEAKRERNK